MSRAVSGAFGTTVASSASYSTATSQYSEAEGSSFGNALDRAQANQSGDNKEPAGTTSDAKSSTDKSNKTSSGRKAPVKKPVATGEGEQSKVQKKAIAPAAQDAEPEGGQGGAESDADQTSGEAANKDQKKDNPPDHAVSVETASAIVQLQNAPAAQATPPMAGASSKDETNPKDSPKPRASTNPRTSAPNGKAPTSKAVASQQTESEGGSPADTKASDSAARSEAVPKDQSADKTANSEKPRLAIQAKNATNAPGETAGNSAAGAAQPTQLTGPATSAQSASPASAIPNVGPVAPSGRSGPKGLDELMLQAASQQAMAAPSATAVPDNDPSAAGDTQASPAAQFSDVNHPKIVSGITGRLLPTGGAMQIRLDPPELGAMQIRVEMHEGVMTASFETSNDQATRLLSHGLGDLRSALEAQGVSVQKLQVSQSPKQQQSSFGDAHKDGAQTSRDTAGQREQQRKEMVRRMWQKLMNGQDPVDLVA